MTPRSRALLPFLPAAALACASPSPIVPDALVVDALRLYGTGDCPGLREKITNADLSAARPEHQAPFDLLLAYCAERDEEILSANDR